MEFTSPGLWNLSRTINKALLCLSRPTKLVCPFQQDAKHYNAGSSWSSDTYSILDARNVNVWSVCTYKGTGASALELHVLRWEEGHPEILHRKLLRDECKAVCSTCNPTCPTDDLLLVLFLKYHDRDSKSIKLSTDDFYKKSLLFVCFLPRTPHWPHILLLRIAPVTCGHHSHGQPVLHAWRLWGSEHHCCVLAVSRPKCHVHVGVQCLTTAVVSCDALHLRLQAQGEVIQFSARSPRLPLSYFVPNLAFGQAVTQRHSTIILGQTSMHQIQQKVNEPQIRKFQNRTVFRWEHASGCTT